MAGERVVFDGKRYEIKDLFELMNDFDEESGRDTPPGYVRNNTLIKEVIKWQNLNIASVTLRLTKLAQLSGLQTNIESTI
jgi:hypothetical protein